MDFALTEEHSMLRTVARDFLAAKCPKKLVRAMIEDDRGYTTDLWEGMAELGWMGLSIPEEYGGAGANLLDLAILIEEMGRACLPGPFFSTVVLGGLSLLQSGSKELKRSFLPKMVQGKLLLTLALTETSGVYSPDTIKTEAIADRQGGFIIRGTKLFVADAHVADYIICVARTDRKANSEERINMFLVKRDSPAVRCCLLKTISGDKQCEVVLDDVKVPEGGILDGIDNGWYRTQQVLEKATAVKCAEMLGGARQVLEMTVSYAKERTAFGHPIGTFQAVQHALADMFIDIEACALVTYDAIWRLSCEIPASHETSIAKALISEAFKKATLSSHQIHGAVGFTADHDLTLYSKRAKASELALGDAHFHLDKIAIQSGIMTV